MTWWAAIAISFGMAVVAWSLLRVAQTRAWREGYDEGAAAGYKAGIKAERQRQYEQRRYQR